MKLSMKRTIVAHFETRRDAEIDVEHLVQAHGVARSDIFIRGQPQAHGRSKHSERGCPAVDLREGAP
jgi:hypothetical protein